MIKATIIVLHAISIFSKYSSAVIATEGPTTTVNSTTTVVPLATTPDVCGDNSTPPDVCWDKSIKCKKYEHLCGRNRYVTCHCQETCGICKNKNSTPSNDHALCFLATNCYPDITRELCPYKCPCIDSALQLVNNVTVMKLSGWNFDIRTGNLPVSPGYPNEHRCNLESNFVAQSWDRVKMSISTAFRGSGRASLEFGNCGSHSSDGRIEVFLNNKKLASALKYENYSINFYYKPQDELKIATTKYYDMMTIYSLQILCKENSFIPCDTLLPIQNCSSSAATTGYRCEKLFDTKSSGSYTSWISNSNDDWVQLNFDENYYIHSLLIFQHQIEARRPENVSLQFSDNTLFNRTILNDYGWNEIRLRQDVTSSYVRLSVKSKYGSGTQVYIPEIQVLGCHIVDCQWGKYDDWSSCSKTCGEGNKWSKRLKAQEALNGGKDCEGPSERNETCNVKRCPEPQTIAPLATTPTSEILSSVGICTCTCKRESTTAELEDNQESVGPDENICSCENEYEGQLASPTIIISLSVIVAFFAIVGLIICVWLRKRNSKIDNNGDDGASIVTIKDFNAESRDKDLREINVRQQEVDESKMEGNVAESIVFEKLNAVLKVEDNLKSNEKAKADLNDVEVVTADQNFYYEL